MTQRDAPGGRLLRVIGVPGAVLMGLGSIVGTGVFVSIGVAVGVAGPAVVLAIALAALTATFNGLSSAQLAASHPVSGGTYEYGYRYLSPRLGFVAGWTFLAAKSSSAATAALGLSGYALDALGADPSRWRVAVAAGLVAVVTLVVLGGIRRSNRSNAVIVSLTMTSLLAFVVIGAPLVIRSGGVHFAGFFTGGSADGSPAGNVLHATALMFVAFTGYGRIATLGEEVRAPKQTIPRAILITLIVSMLLYVGVGAVGVGAVGAPQFAAATREGAAPLEVIARELGAWWLPWALAVGAITAMLGVLLNLVLGLSRVLLAMARRRDMPTMFERIDARGTPAPAVVATGLVVAALALIGNVATTWSFSAFTVLVYYAITNLAALALPEQERRYPRWMAAAGLGACLFLAFWVDTTVWLAGLGLLATGLAWHEVARRLPPSQGPRSSA